MEQVEKGFGGQEDFEKFEEVDFWRERERGEIGRFGRRWFGGYDELEEVVEYGLEERKS